MWYLIGFIWVALIAGIIWSYSRKRQQSAAKRALEYDALISELKSNPQMIAKSTPSTLVASMPTPAPELEPETEELDADTASADAKPSVEVCKKQRVLTPSEALLYYVFRTGLPDHTIFTKISLADLVELEPTSSGYEWDQKARRLAQQKMDFVICTKKMEPLAAIIIDRIEGSEIATRENAKFTEACLRSAGIRLIRLNPARPPRHQDVRTMVYDSSESKIRGGASEFWMPRINQP